MNITKRLKNTEIKLLVTSTEWGRSMKLDRGMRLTDANYHVYD